MIDSIPFFAKLDKIDNGLYSDTIEITAHTQDDGGDDDDDDYDEYFSEYDPNIVYYEDDDDDDEDDDGVDVFDLEFEYRKINFHRSGL